MDLSSLSPDEIVDQVGAPLYRYFCARFSDEDSSDLTQETLIRLLRKYNEGLFDSTRGNLKMFAFGIAHFVALESLKKRPFSIVEMPKDISDNASLEDDYIRANEIKNLRRAILSLPQDEQSVISCVVDQDLTIDEISSILKMPSGTVKSHIHRAKTRLLSLLNQQKKEHVHG